MKGWRRLRKLRCSTTCITDSIDKCTGGINDIKGARPTVANVKVTYDKTANAAYVYFTDPEVRVKVAHMYPCDPVDVDGLINLDFDDQGRLIGIEVLAASSKLPGYLLESAERLDAEGA
ncbi:DUF2283 domain-containing protein [Streptomyces chartreusis]